MNLERFQALKELGFAPHCIVDGGANIGAWARAMRGLFPAARIIAVEGNSDCLPLIREFDPEPSLIGDQESQVGFFVSTENAFATGNSILRENSHFYRGHNSAERIVPMRRLDSILHERGIDRVDLLKLDLQGAELLALKGLGSYLKKTEFIVFEASLVEYNDGQPLFAAVHRFLDEHGFACFDIADQNRVAGVAFQVDFIYVRKGSPFRPIFSSAFDGPRVGRRNITNWSLGSLNERSSILEDLRERKARGKCTVVDVGGSAGGWSSPVVDALVDLNPPVRSASGVRHFRFNICEREGWEELLEYVERNGKFDFSICSHTLEDVRDPVFVCEMLSAISKEGIITVPSKQRELSRFESGPHAYRGYIHHRWIFTVKDGLFIGLPKLNVMEFMGQLDQIASLDESKSELRLNWYNSVDLRIVNNDYMGPNVQSVISYYSVLLADDIQT